MIFDKDLIDNGSYERYLMHLNKNEYIGSTTVDQLLICKKAYTEENFLDTITTNIFFFFAHVFTYGENEEFMFNDGRFETLYNVQNSNTNTMPIIDMSYRQTGKTYMLVGLYIYYELCAIIRTFRNGMPKTDHKVIFFTNSINNANQFNKMVDKQRDILCKKYEIIRYLYSKYRVINEYNSLGRYEAENVLLNNNQGTFDVLVDEFEFCHAITDKSNCLPIHRIYKLLYLLNSFNNVVICSTKNPKIKEVDYCRYIQMKFPFRKGNFIYDPLINDTYKNAFDGIVIKVDLLDNKNDNHSTEDLLKDVFRAGMELDAISSEYFLK